jgi:hypothetical protein
LRRSPSRWFARSKALLLARMDDRQWLRYTLSLLFLSVTFTFDCCSFGLFDIAVDFSLSLSSTTVVLSLNRFQRDSSLCLSPPTDALSISLCRFHLRLLFFHFLAFKCIRLFVTFISDCFSFTFSLPNAFVSLSLSSPTVTLSLSLCRFRLNGGFGAGFRRKHSSSRHPLLLFVFLAGLSGLFQLCRLRFIKMVAL